MALLLLGLGGCRAFDDARVLQTLNQRGFGHKYVGDSNEILTVGIGDGIRIEDPNHPDDIKGSAHVLMDGTIQLPLIGRVTVAGFSTDEIAQALNLRYAEFYETPTVEVYIEDVTSKQYFLRGEVTSVGAKPFKGNTTVWDAVAAQGVPVTADLADIYVIRSDPVHPLIIPVNLRKMLDWGDSRDNILIREDDIIVVNPNLAGIVRNLVDLILEPVEPIVQLAVSVRNIKTIYESFKDDQNFFVGGSSFNQGFGTSSSTFGGPTGTFAETPESKPLTAPGGSKVK